MIKTLGVIIAMTFMDVTSHSIALPEYKDYISFSLVLNWILYMLPNTSRLYFFIANAFYNYYYTLRTKEMYIIILRLGHIVFLYSTETIVAHYTKQFSSI
jgi:DNA modification methylase